MANFKHQLVYVLGTLLQYFVNVLNFYFSAVFFIVLVINEAIYGKVNWALKEKFVEYIDKIIEIPETLQHAFSKDNLQKTFNFNNIF